jgi:hypothetical protein
MGLVEGGHVERDMVRDDGEAPSQLGGLDEQVFRERPCRPAIPNDPSCTCHRIDHDVGTGHDALNPLSYFDDFPCRLMSKRRCAFPGR